MIDFLSSKFEREKDGTNWYAYVGNDPINYIDPNGLVQIESHDLGQRTSGVNINSENHNNGYQDNYYDPDTHSMRVHTEPAIYRDWGDINEVDLGNAPVIGPIIQGVTGFGEISAGLGITGLSAGLAAPIGGMIILDGTTRMGIAAGNLIQDLTNLIIQPELPMVTNDPNGAKSMMDAFAAQIEMDLGHDSFGEDGPGAIRNSLNVVIDVASGINNINNGSAMDVINDTINLGIHIKSVVESIDSEKPDC